MNFYHQLTRTLRAISPYWLIILQMVATVSVGFSMAIFKAVFSQVGWAMALSIASWFGQFAILLTWLPLVLILAIVILPLILILPVFVVGLLWLLVISNSIALLMYSLNHNANGVYTTALVVIASLTGSSCGFLADYYKEPLLLWIVPVAFAIYGRMFHLLWNSQK